MWVFVGVCVNTLCRLFTVPLCFCVSLCFCVYLFVSIRVCFYPFTVLLLLLLLLLLLYNVIHM